MSQNSSFQTGRGLTNWHQITRFVQRFYGKVSGNPLSKKNEPQPRKPNNIKTELAQERNRAAAERSLMAWIRTCLSLISFGFGIDRIVTAIDEGFGQDVRY